MKHFKQAQKYGQRIIGNASGKVIGVVGGTMATVSSAFAEVPAAVSTALTDAKADALTVAGLALVVVIAIAAFKYMRRGV